MNSPGHIGTGISQYTAVRSKCDLCGVEFDPTPRWPGEFAWFLRKGISQRFDDRASFERTWEQKMVFFSACSNHEPDKEFLMWPGEPNAVGGITAELQKEPTGHTFLDHLIKHLRQEGFTTILHTECDADKITILKHPKTHDQSVCWFCHTASGDIKSDILMSAENVGADSLTYYFFCIPRCRACMELHRLQSAVADEPAWPIWATCFTFILSCLALIGILLTIHTISAFAGGDISIRGILLAFSLLAFIVVLLATSIAMGRRGKRLSSSLREELKTELQTLSASHPESKPIEAVKDFPDCEVARAMGFTPRQQYHANLETLLRLSPGKIFLGGHH